MRLFRLPIRKQTRFPTGPLRKRRIIPSGESALNSTRYAPNLVLASPKYYRLTHVRIAADTGRDSPIAHESYNSKQNGIAG